MYWICISSGCGGSVVEGRTMLVAGFDRWCDTASDAVRAYQCYWLCPWGISHTAALCCSLLHYCIPSCMKYLQV